MSVWSGGPCPDCGQDMPARLIHCQFCRALLNPDLYRSDVEIPAFFELKEVPAEMDVDVRGFFIPCPHCDEELRISRKYAGAGVSCKFCKGLFRVNFSELRKPVKSIYTDCPHCEKELRVALKYLGQQVACKFCNGHVLVRPMRGLGGSS